MAVMGIGFFIPQIVMQYLVGFLLFGALVVLVVGGALHMSANQDEEMNRQDPDSWNSARDLRRKDEGRMWRELNQK